MATMVVVDQEAGGRGERGKEGRGGERRETEA